VNGTDRPGGEQHRLARVGHRDGGLRPTTGTGGDRDRCDPWEPPRSLDRM